MHEGVKAMRYNFSNYTPPYLYLLILSTLLPFSKLYSIKFISIPFDFLAAALTFLIVRLKYKNGFVPCLSFIAVLFAPSVFLNSSFWAQCDIIYTTGMLASIYFLIKKRNGMAFICYSIAFSFKLQALILMPLFVVLFLKKDVRIEHFLIIPAGYLIAILPSVFLGGSLKDLLFIYWNQAHTYHFLTANAPNLYQWLPNEHYDMFVKAGMGLTLMWSLYFVLSLTKVKS
jgi:Gpi18-like mannosyltransferase